MTLLTENCPWQTLMNAAYDRWQTHDQIIMEDCKVGRVTPKEATKLTWSFKDMLEHGCYSKAERAACVLGKLNQQVENGGVIQWVDNMYASHSIQYLEDYLRECGPTGSAIWEMLKSFLEEYMDEGGCRQFDDDDYDWQIMQEESDRLSDKFYEMEDEWHKEVYLYLQRLSNPVERQDLPDNGDIV